MIKADGADSLKLECVAIGSMPHKDLSSAISIVKECCSNIPFWPQMVKISKNEDMIIQFLENMPSFFYEKPFLDTDYETFYKEMEDFFLDYETIISGEDCNGEIIEKYAISDKNASSFKYFIDIIKNSNIKFAKGQIVGPFTLATTLVDRNGKCAVYDDTLREIILKTLSIKALWQIKKIKEANPKITPIIFIDEPTITQLGTSAYLTISEESVIDMLSEISSLIQANGGLSAIHCCGKCDWKIPINSRVNMINLDAFGYAQNLSLYSNYVNKFLQNKGKIVWGIIPTLDRNALKDFTVKNAMDCFYRAVKYLTNKGINEKLIIDNSLISPSCGAGGVSIELADKTFKLLKSVSNELKARYNDI